MASVPGREEQRHEQGRAQPDGEGGAHPDPAGHGEQRERHQRPDEVELLLDRERPEVHEQLGGGLVEVARAGGDLEPVRREGERADHLAPDVDEQVLADEPRDEHAGDDAQHERGQQSPGAAHPELGERDTTGAVVLTDEQRGDEEARDDEEDVDAEEAAGQPRRVEVVDEHTGDRKRAKSVEALDREPGAHVRPQGWPRWPFRRSDPCQPPERSPTLSRRSFRGPR